MRQSIVITTIFKPSTAIQHYSKIDGVDLLIVGDKKTPEDWSHPGARYITVEEQGSIGKALNKSIPYNHYCRKMFGYLLAAENESDVIIDTDDDNTPKSEWGFPEFEGKFDSIDGREEFVNIYQWFTDEKIWPRGLPLDLINTSYDTSRIEKERTQKIGIWQGLADDDPDVDAIYRLTNDEPCFFDARSPVVLPTGAICPFNSQNTATRRELFPLLYLPAHVTFRFTDILRGLVAQPIMWLYGYNLGFTEATVIQERNPHDYMKDFDSEVPMYLNTRKVVEIVKSCVSSNETIESNLYTAYSALLNENIVCKDEMKSLEAWLSDLQRIASQK